MRANTALITGVSGQDGSYLAELLLDKGYAVVGTTRDPARRFGLNIGHLEGRLNLVYCDYDLASLIDLLASVAPSEVYNFAGQTFVSKSWEMLPETVDASAVVPMNLLTAILRTDRATRFFQASTCEVFSLSNSTIFSEESPIMPGNPYGCAKAFAQNMVAAFRKNYDMHASSGILFHHESPRRHENFVSRKIVQHAVAIKLGRRAELKLGDTVVARDWSYAPDIVRAIHAMVRQEAPADLVLSSGATHSLLEMVQHVFDLVDLDYRNYLRTDPSLFRARESANFGGDSRRARQQLGWQPRRDFHSMLKAMVEYEMLLQTGKALNFANERPFA